MRKLLIPLLFILMSCGGTTTESTVSEVDNTKVLEIAKSEPKILDAYMNSAGVLYVQVEDDGTRRDGYASYVCDAFKKQGIAADIVRVMKVNTFNDPNKYNAYGVLLGEATCP